MSLKALNGLAMQLAKSHRRARKELAAEKVHVAQSYLRGYYDGLNEALVWVGFYTRNERDASQPD